MPPQRQIWRWRLSDERTFDVYWFRVQMLPTCVLSERRRQDIARHRRPVTHRAAAVLLGCELETATPPNVRFFPFSETTL